MATSDTRTADSDSARPTTEEILSQVEAICASEIFVRHTRPQQILRYIVSETLAGRSPRESDVAVQVIKRNPLTYLSRADSIGRLEVGRLRRLLGAYDAQYGRTSSVRIYIPKGGVYVAQFTRSAVRKRSSFRTENDDVELARRLPGSSGRT